MAFGVAGAAFIAILAALRLAATRRLLPLLLPLNFPLLLLLLLRRRLR